MRASILGREKRRELKFGAHSLGEIPEPVAARRHVLHFDPRAPTQPASGDGGQREDRGQSAYANHLGGGGSASPHVAVYQCWDFVFSPESMVDHLRSGSLGHGKTSSQQSNRKIIFLSRRQRGSRAEMVIESPNLLPCRHSHSHAGTHALDERLGSQSAMDGAFPNHVERDRALFPVMPGRLGCSKNKSPIRSLLECGIQAGEPTGIDCAIFIRVGDEGKASLVTTRLPLADGRIINIRKPSQPDDEQKRVYQMLGIDWKSAFPTRKTEIPT